MSKFKTQYKAYDGHILVMREDISNVTDSGLVIPDSAKKKQAMWEVVDVGFGVERISVGDYVIYKDSSVFMGANVIVKDHAVFIDEPNGVIAVRKDNVVAVFYSTRENKENINKAPWVEDYTQR